MLPFVYMSVENFVSIFTCLLALGRTTPDPRGSPRLCTMSKHNLLILLEVDRPGIFFRGQCSMFGPWVGPHKGFN